MDTPTSSSTSLAQTALELARTIGSGLLGAFLSWLYQRKKLKPEIQQIDAVTAKTYAEARHIDGETLGDAYKRIEELYVICDGQRTQISRQGLTNDKQAMELEFQEAEIKWLKGVLDAAGIRLSDYDYLRRKGPLTAPSDEKDVDKT